MTRRRRKLLYVRSKSCVSDEVWPHMEFDSRFRKCIMFTAMCCDYLEHIACRPLQPEQEQVYM